jgi:hypothetical protein
VSATVNNLKRFVEYAHTLQGDEKGEAQVFCDRLFIPRDAVPSSIASIFARR